ncbi:MAG: membrane protein insertase YidC [Syntrophaceae bacterium]|nr:membrane protein insertase YidC [Syntrophaceae bacterium]
MPPLSSRRLRSGPVSEPQEALHEHERTDISGDSPVLYRRLHLPVLLREESRDPEAGAGPDANPDPDGPAPGNGAGRRPGGARGRPARTGSRGEAAAAAKDIRVETPLYTAVFSTRGGALKSLQLKEYRATLDEGSPLIEMVAVQEGSELPLSTAFTGSTIDLPGDVAFEADRKELDLTGGAGPGRLVFTCAVPGQYRVEKIYTFLPDRYSFDLEVRFVNATNAALNQSLSIRWLEELNKKGLEEEGAVARAKNSTEREAGAKLEKRLTDPTSSGAASKTSFSSQP